MSKSTANVLKFVASAISYQVGTNDDTAPSSTWTDLGLQSEETLKLTMNKIANREAGGGELQTGYECKVETDSMEVLNVAAIESGVKNVMIWLKCAPIGSVGATNPGIYVKYFMGNVELDLNLSAKGKSAVKISGSKYCNSIDEFYGTYTS